MSKPKPIIELKKVSKWYESDPDQRKVINNLDLTISAAEMFAIVGPSGCGKSTLLNLLGILDSPSQGEIFVSGETVTSKNETQLAAVRSQQIGFIFQLHHLLPQCSALENVLVPTLALPNKPDADVIEARAKSLFEKVGLDNKLNSKPAELSGGERQRVAVIRSLINQPGILLADEPTGALDEANAQNLVELLVELNQSEKLAIVMVTHDQEKARQLGDVRTLKNGQLT